MKSPASLLTKEEAIVRADTWENDDPFPEIFPALLSSAEISDYARATGMVYPFYLDALKSASYEAHIGGEFILWDGTGQRKTRTISRGDPCVLPANSISFVQVEPTFRLPNYLALRFNLRITHVHRGLLLGTGPLVDPGFAGKLLIPLHNLTSSDYDLDTTEALIWIEFTKTSFVSNNGSINKPPSLPERKGKFKGFPPKKRHFEPDQYLRKANAGNPIRSSIPNVEARIVTAEKAAERARNLVFGFGAVAAAGILFALYAVYTDTSSLVISSQSLFDDRAGSLTREIADLQEEIDKLRTDNATQKQKLLELEAALRVPNDGPASPQGQ